MSLGDFGVEHEPLDETFRFFGEEVRVNPDLSSCALRVLFDNDATVNDLVAALVHEDDVEAFWVLAATNRQTYSDLSDVAWQVVGAIAERPTKLPSDSSSGQQTTNPSSAPDSSLPALTLLQGRADLAVAVVQMQDAAASA